MNENEIKSLRNDTMKKSKQMQINMQLYVEWWNHDNR